MMKTFQDALTLKVWQFEDDVVMTNVGGVYSFATPFGVTLVNTPSSLQPYTIPAPSSAQLLSQAQIAKIESLAFSYDSAISQPISLTTAAGITKIFQTDKNSQSNLANELLIYQATTTVPTGYYWVSQDNTQVPFTYADLQGLAATIGARGWAAFQNLQSKKSNVLAATALAAVQAVVW